MQGEGPLVVVEYQEQLVSFLIPTSRTAQGLESLASKSRNSWTCEQVDGMGIETCDALRRRCRLGGQAHRRGGTIHLRR